jgi:hypothetical protein
MSPAAPGWVRIASTTQQKLRSLRIEDYHSNLLEIPK